MRYAVLSDVHANLQALEAVLRDTVRQRIDQVVFLGDAVGYGGSPVECLRLLQAEAPIQLAGNHDHAAAGLISVENFNPVARISIEWTRERLGAGERSLLRSLPLSHVEGDLYFVHASPQNPSRWKYVRTPEDAQEVFRAIPHRLCFIGHTHVAMAYRERPSGPPRRIPDQAVRLHERERYLFNVGSVGQPRDGDERACYLVLDVEARTAAYRRVTYDLHGSQRSIVDQGLPAFLAERLAEAR
jgi:diadenosine tetraphosphatase ApaH/serine/threonine PP2A family protein phosphatase